jgi:pyruvate dehydrogenase E2 component (dihydrolipoamide acetyltransferase)
LAEFLMPSLGADMDQGQIVEWRVKPGDAVHRGDIVAVVDTKKADIEIEIFEDGVVEELLADVGDVVPVGTPIARLAAAGAETPAAEPPRAPAAHAGTVAEVVPEPARSSAALDGRRRVSPLARRTAEELGVDLAAVEGTGSRGAVTVVDVERAAQAAKPEAPVPPPAPARPERPAPSPTAAADRQVAMRESIAALMARSKREIPHYYLGTDVDLSAALRLLERRNAELPVKERLLPAVVLVKAVALALHDFPELNGFWNDGRFEPSHGVHVGFAVSLRGGGLIAPAIHDADRLTLDQLMAATRDLVRRTRDGGLRASEMSDPTFTVTSLGERGVEEVYGVIYPPQVAIAGFGRIVDRPIAVDGMLAVRPTVRATLSGDHRATDGHLGARFLAAVADRLQRPEEL